MINTSFIENNICITFYPIIAITGNGFSAVLYFVAILTSCSVLLFGNRKAHVRWAEGGGKRPSAAPRSASVGLGEPPEKSGPRRIRAAHGPLSGGGKAPTAK